MAPSNAIKPVLPTAPAQRRMDLAKVVRGKIETPTRVLIYGVEGIGKSTWAAGAEAPIFLCGEDGTASLDVARFPAPETWQDVLDAVRTLTTEQHEYRTLVIDTVDAIEAWLWRHICDRDHQQSIEGYGYGKGYVAALDEWRVLLAALEQLRRAKGMQVILVGHSMIRTFKNPEGEDFDRYELKLHAKAGGLLKEWCDALLFAHYETFAVKDDRKGTVKGVSSGARVVHTTRTAAWDAKNRYDLPDVLPLSHEDFSSAVAAHRPADPAKLKQSIAERLTEITDAALVAIVQATVAKAGDDAAQLARIDNRLAAKVAALKGV